MARGHMSKHLRMPGSKGQNKEVFCFPTWVFLARVSEVQSLGYGSVGKDTCCENIQPTCKSQVYTWKPSGRWQRQIELGRSQARQPIGNGELQALVIQLRKTPDILLWLLPAQAWRCTPAYSCVYKLYHTHCISKGIQSHLWLYRKFEVRLAYLRPCHKQTKNKQNQRKWPCDYALINNL